MVLKPEAASMLSLFCVLVCVVAQPSNKAVHAATTLQTRVHLINFIGRNRMVDMISESNSGGDLRAVHHDVELKVIVLEVRAKCSITDFGKNAPSPVEPNYALNL